MNLAWIKNNNNKKINLKKLNRCLNNTVIYFTLKIHTRISFMQSIQVEIEEKLFILFLSDWLIIVFKFKFEAIVFLVSFVFFIGLSFITRKWLCIHEQFFPSETDIFWMDKKKKKSENKRQDITWEDRYLWQKVNKSIKKKSGKKLTFFAVKKTVFKNLLIFFFLAFLIAYQKVLSLLCFGLVVAELPVPSGSYGTPLHSGGSSHGSFGGGYQAVSGGFQESEGAQIDSQLLHKIEGKWVIVLLRVLINKCLERTCFFP